MSQSTPKVVWNNEAKAPVQSLWCQTCFGSHHPTPRSHEVDPPHTFLSIRYDRAAK